LGYSLHNTTYSLLFIGYEMSEIYNYYYEIYKCYFH